MKKTIFSLILFLVISGMAINSDAQVISLGVSIRIGPPVIPVYVQPACPVDGYLWVPGYWAYSDDGYYWVPGYWAAPPEVGFLWTPGYWGYDAGLYGWHAGYWGPHVGFYGGVNYGCGYGGVGFYGGGWVGGHFRYNTAVTNVNTTVVHNTYIDRTVVRNVTSNRVSYNGGPGGLNARPTAVEEAAARDHHVEATTAQLQHQHLAGQDRSQYASVNHGRPANTAVARTTAYHPTNVGSMAHSTTLNRPATSNNGNRAPAVDRAPAVSHAPSVNHTPSLNHTPSVNHAPAVNHSQERTIYRPQTQHQAPQRQVSHQAPPRQAPHVAPHPAARPAPREGGGEERHHR